MPATTRSKTQTTLEDKGVSSSKPAPTKASGAKRKASETKTPATKKQKTQPTRQEQSKAEDQIKDEGAENGEEDPNNSITINRAPILSLWSSCLTHFLHPTLPWSTALNIGAAISTITAISKGRSIGTIDKPNPVEASTKREERREAQADLDEINIMSFHLKIKNGNAMVGDKPQKGSEKGLRGKFGGEGEYERCKEVMQEALEGWRGQEEELEGRAWGMYEEFRPSVPKGQKGWGRKGVLRLESVRSAVGGG